MWNKTDMEEYKCGIRYSETQIDTKKDRDREVREATERKKEAIRVDTQTDDER